MTIDPASINWFSVSVVGFAGAAVLLLLGLLASAVHKADKKD